MRDGLLAFRWVAATSGCSYDWTVGPSSSDAASEVVSAADAADAVGADVAADASTDVSPADAPDGPEAAPLSPCNGAQEAPVQQARTAALDCTGVTPNPCKQTMQDECMCPVVVAAQNQAKADYVTAILQLEKTCIPSCPGCGPAPMTGLCIVTDAGSTALACYE